MKFPTSDLQTFQDATRQHNVNRTLGRHSTPIPMGAALVVCHQTTPPRWGQCRSSVLCTKKCLLNQRRWSRTALVQSPISLSSLWRHKKALNSSFFTCAVVFPSTCTDHSCSFKPAGHREMCVHSSSTNWFLSLLWLFPPNEVETQGKENAAKCSIWACVCTRRKTTTFGCFGHVFVSWFQFIAT